MEEKEASAPKQATGLARGRNRGTVVKRRAYKKPCLKKGALSSRTQLIREVVREVSGYTPYERRIIELIKGGGTNSEKRARRFAKKRLGTWSRAKRKYEELSAAIADGKA